jgi:hypothetical protein
MDINHVSNELRYIREKVDQHDQLFVRMVEIQERQIAQNDRLTEYMDRNDKRLEKVETKVDAVEVNTRSSVAKAHTRIDENKATILKWSGGIAALITAISVIGVLWRIMGG